MRKFYTTEGNTSSKKNKKKLILFWRYVKSASQNILLLAKAIEHMMNVPNVVQVINHSTNLSFIYSKNCS